MTATFGKFEELTTGSHAHKRVLVYQLPSIQGRDLSITVIVQEEIGSGHCPSTLDNFGGIAIFPGKVFVGCCRQAEKEGK
jgi:hypothetical protein